MPPEEVPVLRFLAAVVGAALRWRTVPPPPPAPPARGAAPFPGDLPPEPTDVADGEAGCNRSLYNSVRHVRFHSGHLVNTHHRVLFEDRDLNEPF